MWRYIILCFIIAADSFPKAIYTPTLVDEIALNVPAPDGWAAKHYNVNAGLKAVFWPLGFNPINTDLMIFVFIGNKSAPSRVLQNMEPFRYKCPGMGMTSIPDVKTDTENSLEKYFSGRCGRGMALVHIDEGYYSLLILLVSSRYLTTNQMKALDILSKAYKSAMIKAMGKDYYMVRDGVNRAVKDMTSPDYKVPMFDPSDGRPINRQLPAHTAQAPSPVNTQGNDLKTTTIIKEANQKAADDSFKPADIPGPAQSFTTSTEGNTKPVTVNG